MNREKKNPEQTSRSCGRKKATATAVATFLVVVQWKRVEMDLETDSICLAFFEQYVNCFVKKKAKMPIQNLVKHQRNKNCIGKAKEIEWVGERIHSDTQFRSSCRNSHQNGITYQLNGQFLFYLCVPLRYNKTFILLLFELETLFNFSIDVFCFSFVHTVASNERV